MRALSDINKQKIMDKGKLQLIRVILQQLLISQIKLIFFNFRFSQLTIPNLLDLEPLLINNKGHIQMITSLFLFLTKVRILTIINKF
jgi:hypothetical protein